MQSNADAEGPTLRSLLFLEPFYGGSHKQLVDLLAKEFGGDLHSLPASKWHWRSRVAALHFAHTLPAHHNYQILFCSSVLNLCELVALRPDLGALQKVLYFHENQLVYPVRKKQDRDFQYGYNQILSCLVADYVVFNSHYNKHSFLDGIDGHLQLIPDFRPRGLAEQIRHKCRVLYFPVDLPPHISPSHYHKEISDRDSDSQAARPLHIVWPHRWEHDKGPDEFCEVLLKLLEAEKEFIVSFLGSHTEDIPTSIRTTQSRLGKHVVHFGPLPREHYWKVLQQADIAVSTAKHEFFGVAMMEAVACGCYPLCPNRLVYPEIYPKECLYNTEQQLYKKLSGYCDRPWNISHIKDKVNYSLFTWAKLKQAYFELLNISITSTS